MDRKISLGFAFILVCFAVLLTFMITYVHTYNKFNRELANTGPSDRIIAKIAELEQIAGSHYIGEIDRQKIIDGLAMGYVMGLGDRYAYYYDAKEYAAQKLVSQGKLVGIGVEVLYADIMGGALEITAVYPDSPASAGGMHEGDYIYMVEGELVSELGYYGSIDRVRGEIGTEVTLTVLRGEPDFEELTLTFTRDEVKTPSVKYRMINADVGYIRIKEFHQETPKEFKDAIDSLSLAGASKYIFDLRYNLGGDLMGITKSLDYLLPEGPIIRYSKKGREPEAIYSDAEEIIAPMAVLMNEHTASAAELFCAALQDYEKAVLIGKTTYGKGTMQGIYTLGDGMTAIKLSNAKYLPPFSECYDGIGVFPHMEVDLPEGLLKEKNFEKITDEEDTQLQAAIKALEN